MTPDRDHLEALAIEALTQARATMLEQHPFLASLTLQLDLVPVWDDRVPTAATDGTRIYIRPDWILERTPAQRQFILAHEVGHCVMGHFRRTTNRDHHAWNLAMDHEINGLLIREGLQPPPDHIFFEAYDGLGAEQVYDRLAHREDLPERGIHCDVHPGQEPPEGTRLERDHRYRPLPDPDVLRRWPERVRQAEIARSRRGDRPGRLEQAVHTLLNARALPWRSLLAQFVTRSFGGSATWLPPSRRHVHRGLYLPSRQSQDLSVAVVVDTSGSTAEYLPAFANEVSAIITAFPCYSLTWIACDAQIQAVVQANETHPLDPDHLQLPGGGGTDLRPPFSWLDQQPEFPTMVIYLTDGYGPAPDQAPPFPVLWVLTPDGKAPAPWGDVVTIDHYNEPV